MKKYIKIVSLLSALLLLFGACAPEATAPETETETETELKWESETETETETETEPVTETETEPETETETEREVVHVTGLVLDRYSVNITVGTWEMPLVTMTPDNADDKSEIWATDNAAVATVDAYGNIYGVASGDCKVTVTSADNPSLVAEVAVHVDPKPEPKPEPKGDPAPASGVTYIQGILIANKTYALPADYDPGIDPTAYAALNEMFAGAAQDGITLWIASGYRSYATQNWLYNNYVAMDGKAAADTYSARPGHSEHQTGLAFDLNDVSDYFANTDEGIWLANNCWKYGFIIRYPAGKEAKTGYKYEPWHVRYLGRDVAKAVYESGLCLEEYLGITSVYSY